ncbi:RHS repeat-associated core domain protein [Streptomyces sp. KO7888]|uniref:RHS repeat-associated core domain-containing protein n=1 Tax=Streptomyces sp. KO7888 TaxID=2602737 RepID=UPI0013F60D28|nr:RHS repeat-associated core domain protein [Streptomyces sp. KO7888]
MAGHRPSDWHVLDLDKDPTPGDPQRVRTLAKTLHDFADDVSEALRLVKGMAGESTLAEWAGKSATVFKDEFSGVPKNLKKLEKSYGMCGDALADFWPKLERAQALADRALVKAREARDDLTSAQSKLSSADSWVTRASKEADKYKDDPTGSKSDADKPDEAKVRAATRDVQHAKTAQTNAQSSVDSAQGALDAAKKMAADARKMRDDAAREAKNKIDEASDAGIQNRSWWEDVGDWFSDNWDNIVAVCKVVVAIVGIIAMVIGGPILGAIVLVAALVVLADTLYKYSKGQASLWDVGLAALDCIPGMKGLTTLGALAKGAKNLGKLGLKGMAKGLGKGLRREADDAVAKGKPMDGRCKGGDPIDMVSGEMLMEHTDVELPGLLPLVLRRTHVSTYASGQLFGPSWASTLDERLELDDEGASFASEDGMVLFYPIPAQGSSTMPLEGPRWPLDWDGGPSSPLRISDPVTGLTRHFAALARPAASAEVFTLPLVAISDRNGHRIVIDRDDDGTPVAVRHSGGYHVHVDTEAGHVVRLRLRDPDTGTDGVTLLRYAFDEDGNLNEIHNSSGLAFRMTYDSRARITSWTDRNGGWFRYSYDHFDRCVRAEGADGILSCGITYDTEARETRYTNSLGHTTVHRYNELLQRTELVDALGRTIRTAWDRYDRPVSRTDSLGRTTTFEYDGSGSLRSVTRPDGRRTTAQYNELNLPVRVVEPDGAVWEQSFDARGNRLKITDPTGSSRQYSYDEQGRLTAVVDALGHMTRTTCDPAGLTIVHTDALGHTTRAERDAFGRVCVVTDAEGDTERMGWTVEGHPAWRVAADGSRESWEWDGEGNLVAHVDPTGHRSSIRTKYFHQPAVRTDANGREYRFTYDTELNLTRVTNAQGDTWEYVYDPVNRLTAETDFEGRTVTYAHDDAGRLIGSTNGNGEETTFVRDELGRVVTRRAGGRVTRYAYDPVGRLRHAATDESTLERAYDPAGRLVREVLDGAVTTYVHDSMGRRIRRSTPSGIVSTWSYDALGRPAALDAAGHSVTFDFDSRGREQTRAYGGFAELTQTWDSRGRLAGQRLHGCDPRGGRTLLQERAYTHRADGVVSGISELTTGSRTLDLDTVGQVTTVRGSNWAESYTYDALGNVRQSVTPAGGEEPVTREYRSTRLLRSGRTRYEYDGQGRPVRTVKRLLNGQKRVSVFTWDAQDRLTAVLTPAGDTWNYRYDPTGRRCAKVRLGPGGEVAEETRFTWDGTRVAEQAEADGSTTSWDYFSGTHRPLTHIRKAVTGEVRFHGVVTDTVGASTELVDEAGALAWHRRSELWGRDLPDARDEQASSGDVDCPLRFPGQYADAETGWHYNFARYYDPENGRYLTPDPLGLAPQPNHYGYVPNPLLFVDPLGLARMRDKKGRYASDPDAPATRHNRSSEYPHEYWDSTHEDMVTRFTDEGRTAGGWPVDPVTKQRIPRDQLTWRNNAGEIVDADPKVLTYDHKPRVVEHWNSTGYNTDYAAREAWYNDTTEMEPMTRADNGRDGAKAPEYRQDTGPSYKCRGA